MNIGDKKLYRSRDDQMVTGVCGGLAEYFGIDATLIRLAFAVAVLAGFGSGVPLYIALAIIIPEEPLDATLERTLKERREVLPHEQGLDMHETPVAPPADEVPIHRNN